MSAPRRCTRLVVTAALITAASTGALLTAAPAHASACRAGITGGDVGVTGSSGAAGEDGLTLPDFGSYRAGDRKPQGLLPTFDGPTRALEWVTGPRSPNHTDTRFSITATDVGLPWDNGAGQVLMAFGDTWGKCGATMEWRHNTLLRSTFDDPAKGIRFPDAAPGNTRSGASVTAAHPTFAQSMINAVGVRNIEVGQIPTGAIAIDGIQYLSVMSIHRWGAPGRWDTNYSAIVSSRDNGQSWITHPDTIRANVDATVPGVSQITNGHSRFQMGSFLRAGDWVYQYGTPAGRSGSAYIARFKPADILKVSRYEYFSGSDRWSSDPAAATPIVGAPVSELSVAYNGFLKKFVMLTENGGHIMMRTSPTPVGPWSAEKVLISPKQSSGLYTPYIHPASTGSMLYYVVSRWDDYNVMLVATDLSKM